MVRRAPTLVVFPQYFHISLLADPICYVHLRLPVLVKKKKKSQISPYVWFASLISFLMPPSLLHRLPTALCHLWPHQKTKESHLVDWKSNRFYYSRTKKYFHTPYWDIMLYLFSVISDDNQLQFENETFMLKICFDHIQSYCSIQYTLMLPDCASDCEWLSLYLVWMLRHFPSPSFFFCCRSTLSFLRFCFLSKNKFAMWLQSQTTFICTSPSAVFSFSVHSKWHLSFVSALRVALN